MKIRSILKPKQSQAHVEMIVSFVIFAGFITAMLYFLNPFQNRQISYTILDITEAKLVGEWTAEYKTTSVTFDRAQGGCFAINNAVGLQGSLLAKDESGNIHKGATGGNIHIDSSSSSRYYKLYASSSFSSNSVSCEEVLPETNSYQFGASDTKEAIFYSNIEQMIQEYESDYEALKTKLDLQNDFVFYVINQDTEEQMTSATMTIPTVVEVIARDIPVIALDQNANQLNLIINIRTW